MITAAVILAAGFAVGVTAGWAVASRRADQGDMTLMRLRRHNADLCRSNALLSERCGFCGTSRTMPTGGH
ncbi:hypothetical protein AB0I72_19705 [Nocardiopsis sp. NPDC049922]|uniref:hypothetical protein n=1 Tax=Nocardiopsis sp. NPDC049922 TaxID=3155157 RepID=UPI0033D02134